MSHREEQQDELNAIESIFPDLLAYDGEHRVIFNFPLGVRLTISLPENYPVSEPPSVELSGPCLSSTQRCDLLNAINDAYIENMGMPILYDWITVVKEFIDSLSSEQEVGSGNEGETSQNSSQDADYKRVIIQQDHLRQLENDIKHGEPFTDRKSHFQAHLCRINSKEQADQVMTILTSNNKISRATHNIYAWRVTELKNGREIRQHDCADDGETGASAKMLDLLEKMGANNVIVVVSRWYGGIHLGPDRFRHINNLTRQILADSGMENRDKNKK